jgi:hypothetical protein
MVVRWSFDMELEFTCNSYIYSLFVEAGISTLKYVRLGSVL